MTAHRFLANRFLDWGTELVGSTRPVALMRIGLALIVWVRFGDEVTFFQAVSPIQIMYGSWLLGLAAAALVGLYPRLALLLLAVTLGLGYFGFGYTIGMAGWYHHHVYLLMVAAFLLALSPCDRSYSIDRYREIRHFERRGQAMPPERGNLWAQQLIALQLSAIYFWTAIDKTDWAFLSGQRLEQALIWIHTGRPLEEWLLWPPFLIGASIVVVIVEYFLAFAIHVRRWHWFVLPLGIGLHMVFYLLLPVDTYSVTMILLYLALLDPDSVHRFIDRMQGHASASHRL